MTHFSIGTIVHEKFGELQIYFNGPNQEVTFEKYSPETGRQRVRTGIIPRSLLDALEIFENANITGNHAKCYSNVKLYEFDRDELRAEEERITKLRAESKRRVMYVGAPTVSYLIKLLERLVAEDSDLASFPVYCGGADWYLHIDKQDRCMVFDEERLYEEYELDE